jgi:hypothetical protein
LAYLPVNLFVVVDRLSLRRSRAVATMPHRRSKSSATAV